MFSNKKVLISTSTGSEFELKRMLINWPNRDELVECKVVAWPKDFITSKASMALVFNAIKSRALCISVSKLLYDDFRIETRREKEIRFFSITLSSSVNGVDGDVREKPLLSFTLSWRVGN